MHARWTTPVTQALRSGSVESLRAELLRLLVAGRDLDLRDLLVGLAPYHDCAARLGVDPGALLRRCPRLAAGATRLCPRLRAAHRHQARGMGFRRGRHGRRAALSATQCPPAQGTFLNTGSAGNLDLRSALQDWKRAEVLRRKTRFATVTHALRNSTLSWLGCRRVCGAGDLLRVRGRRSRTMPADRPSTGRRGKSTRSDEASCLRTCGARRH